MEYLKLISVIVLLLGSLLTAVISVAGVFKFKYVLNRMHAAALCDTLMLLLASVGVIVSYGFCFASLKVLVILLCVWMASPVSSHVISRLVVTTDKDLSKECEVRK